MSEEERKDKMANSSMANQVHSLNSQVQYQVTTPEPFNFREPSEWPRWIRKFERFRVASELDKKSEANQVNMFLYCIGDEGEDLLVSFDLTSEELGSYEIVKSRFESYLGFKINIVYERAKFFKRRQGAGESIDIFINSLHKLAEHCKFGILKEELIRDMIVIGVADNKLSEFLQLDDKLTLNSAILKARQTESLQQQQQVVRETHEIEYVRNSSCHVGAKSLPENYLKKQNQGKNYLNKAKCNKCGLSHHQNNECPAGQAVCFKCNVKGHYVRCCPQQQRSAIREVNVDEQQHAGHKSYLGELTVDEVGDFNPSKIELSVGKHNIIFKLDTGADVSLIGYDMCQLLNWKLKTTNKLLFGPGNTHLKVVGMLTTPITFKGKTIEEDIYVIENQPTPLLSRQAMLKLKIVQFNIDSVDLDKICSQFQDIFSSIGEMLGEKYKIKLTNNSQGFAVAAPRRVAAPLMDKLKNELTRLHSEGIIEPIVEPTEWCAPIVVVPRKSGDRVRLCVDYTELNKNVLRERWQLPTVDESLSKLEGGSYFSLLDATNGFLQVPLDPSSYKLTTFITPFGRYFFKRLPFGINSGPEVYQRRIYQVLDGLNGVINQADDILIVGRTQEEHDHRLLNVLQRLREHKVTLNKEKCRINVRSIKFLGHLIENGQIKPDPDKVKAIVSLRSPTNVNELRHLLGMVNYLMKFVPNLAEITAPLRILLKKGYQWTWSEIQEKAWIDIKDKISSTPVLLSYNNNNKTRVAADASSFGLGGLIEQCVDGSWKPIMYASRSLSQTEMRYAQIEKEALALTWACERFSTFLLGSEFELMTDHKPLVELLGSKPISSLSARLQRFKMRLACFRYSVIYVSGKQFYAPDVLSRNPLSEFRDDQDILEKDWFIQSVIDALPCTDKRLQEIQTAQEKDNDCQRIKEWITNDSWNKNSVYWKFRSELNITNGLILKGSRLFIPQPLRKEILGKIHEGHMGIVKCRRRMNESVWWLGCSTDIATVVSNCDICLRQRRNKSEPLILSDLPKNPWEILGLDLLKCNGRWYLVAQDYYSRFLELVHIDVLITEAVVARLKNIFARHGVPYSVRVDGGPQFTSQYFKQFAEEYGFNIIVSSPKFPQSNGEAEKAVDIAKRILTKCNDPNLGLLEYRNTPLESGLSPAELLYSRKLRSTLPSISNFRPVGKDRLTEFKKKDLALKLRNKINYDCRKGVRDLSKLKENDKVWIADMSRYGKVERKTKYPRSYHIRTSMGNLRRNRRNLIPVNEQSDQSMNYPNVFIKDSQCPNETQDSINNKGGDNLEEMKEREDCKPVNNERPKRNRKPPNRYSDSNF